MKHSDIHYPGIYPEVFRRIRSYSRYVFSRSPLRDKIELGDLMQEACLEVIQATAKGHKAKAVHAVKRAEARLARRHGHVVVDRREAFQLIEGVSLDEHLPEGSVFAWLPDGAENEKQVMRIIFKARKYLQLHQRQFARMCFLQGFSARQCAKSIGKKPDNAHHYQRQIEHILRASEAGETAVLASWRRKVLYELSRKRGIPKNTFYNRLNRGLTGAELFAAPRKRRAS